MQAFTPMAVVLLLLFAAIQVNAQGAPGFQVSMDPTGNILLDPTLQVPQWYEDSQGLQLGLCMSQTPSPNAAAAGKPMCPPSNPSEAMYNSLQVKAGPGFKKGAKKSFGLLYVAALFFTYLPKGVPAPKTQVVIARLRYRANILTAGDYVVTHPFGVHKFPGLPVGIRAMDFTVDVPLAPMDFTSCMNAGLGPYICWDQLNPGETLSVGGNQFCGDSNYDHTFTGSPLGINYVQVDGPPGSDLDGAGNPSVKVSVGTVTGQFMQGSTVPQALLGTTTAFAGRKMMGA